MLSFASAINLYMLYFMLNNVLTKFLASAHSREKLNWSEHTSA
jgi:hypothetical protein